MTNEEKAALKERFKAGSVPSESDYAALIDTIDAGGSNSSVLVIPANVDLRNEVMLRAETTHTQYTITNPYTYTTVPELLDAYSVISGTDVRNVSQVIITNESWDSMLTQNETTDPVDWDISSNGLYVPINIGDSTSYSWSYDTVYSSYNAWVDSSSGPYYYGTFRGDSYPLFILTDHSTIIPGFDHSDDDGPWYGGNMNAVEDKVIDAIPRGRACMFIKRARTVKSWYNGSSSDITFNYWVPVNRGTTVTTYELGQMYQDFEANPHPDSGGSSS